jgi:hypothetical protein
MSHSQHELSGLAEITRMLVLCLSGYDPDRLSRSVGPVAAGFVESFARPGRNITGFVFFESSMAGKWLGILKEIAPALSRAGFADRRLWTAAWLEGTDIAVVFARPIEQRRAWDHGTSIRKISSYIPPAGVLTHPHNCANFP